MNRSRTALVLLAVSVGVIVAMVLYLGVLRWQSAEGAAVASVGSRPAVSASPSPTPTAAPAPVETSASPSPTPTPTSEPVMVAAPVRVSIPALDVDTKVFPVGLDENEAIEIPEDIRYVGWYDLGVPPGVDRGSAVLVAHRDGRVQGRGVFYFLGTLDVGDTVIVQTSAGDDLPYEVVSRESILKKRLPYEELFAVDGPPRLTLISCGGYYDPDNGGYQDNVVVTAVPLFDPVVTDPVAPAVEATPAVTSAEGPVAVSVPEAATVRETSQPRLLGGSDSR